ncbi:hypothetical protein J6590_031721 [Homalodisca vitripennis]|nr:hypothetical protein J6590_031721 [Homalodisca vitripennis]
MNQMGQRALGSAAMTVMELSYPALHLSRSKKTFYSAKCLFGTMAITFPLAATPDPATTRRILAIFLNSVSGWPIHDSIIEKLESDVLVSVFRADHYCLGFRCEVISLSTAGGSTKSGLITLNKGKEEEPGTMGASDIHSQKPDQRQGNYHALRSTRGRLVQCKTTDVKDLATPTDTVEVHDKSVAKSTTRNRQQF